MDYRSNLSELDKVQTLKACTQAELVRGLRTPRNGDGEGIAGGSCFWVRLTRGERSGSIPRECCLKPVPAGRVLTTEELFKSVEEALGHKLVDSDEEETTEDPEPETFAQWQQQGPVAHGSVGDGPQVQFDEPPDLSDDADLLGSHFRTRPDSEEDSSKTLKKMGGAAAAGAAGTGAGLSPKAKTAAGAGQKPKAGGGVITGGLHDHHRPKAHLQQKPDVPPGPGYGIGTGSWEHEGGRAGKSHPELCACSACTCQAAALLCATQCASGMCMSNKCILSICTRLPIQAIPKPCLHSETCILLSTHTHTHIVTSFFLGLADAAMALFKGLQADAEHEVVREVMRLTSLPAREVYAMHTVRGAVLLHCTTPHVLRYMLRYFFAVQEQLLGGQGCCGQHCQHHLCMLPPQKSDVRTCKRSAAFTHSPHACACLAPTAAWIAGADSG